MVTRGYRLGLPIVGDVTTLSKYEICLHLRFTDHTIPAVTRTADMFKCRALHSRKLNADTKYRNFYVHSLMNKKQVQFNSNH